MSETKKINKHTRIYLLVWKICFCYSSPRIIDFGLSQVIKPGQPCQAVHGTPEFVAPEVLAYEPVSFPADIWSIGIITYILLSGCSPFLGDDKSETFDRILDLDYDFDDEIFADVSNDAKNFIADILQRHPRSRPSAKKCLKMDWVNSRGGKLHRIYVSFSGKKQTITEPNVKFPPLAISATTRTKSTSSKPC